MTDSSNPISGYMTEQCRQQTCEINVSICTVSRVNVCFLRVCVAFCYFHYGFNARNKQLID